MSQAGRQICRVRWLPIGLRFSDTPRMEGGIQFGLSSASGKLERTEKGTDDIPRLWQEKKRKFTVRDAQRSPWQTITNIQSLGSTCRVLASQGVVDRCYGMPVRHSIDSELLPYNEHI